MLKCKLIQELPIAEDEANLLDKSSPGLLQALLSGDSSGSACRTSFFLVCSFHIFVFPSQCIYKPHALENPDLNPFYYKHLKPIQSLSQRHIELICHGISLNEIAVFVSASHSLTHHRIFPYTTISVCAKQGRQFQTSRVNEVQFRAEQEKKVKV